MDKDPDLNKFNGVSVSINVDVFAFGNAVISVVSEAASGER